MARPRKVHYVPVPQLSLSTLTALLVVSYVAVAIALVVAVLDGNDRSLAVAVAVMTASAWLDRQRLARMFQMRTAHLLALWQEDIAALRLGAERPDLRLLTGDEEPS